MMEYNIEQESENTFDGIFNRFQFYNTCMMKNIWQLESKYEAVLKELEIARNAEK